MKKVIVFAVRRGCQFFLYWKAAATLKFTQPELDQWISRIIVNEHGPTSIEIFIIELPRVIPEKYINVKRAQSGHPFIENLRLCCT